MAYDKHAAILDFERSDLPPESHINTLQSSECQAFVLQNETHIYKNLHPL